MQRVCVQVKSKEQPVSYKLVLAIPGGSDGKDSACSAVQSLSQEDLLEEGMATHSSILTWRIPWTEESGRLWFVGLQRVGHDKRFSMHTLILTPET